MGALIQGNSSIIFIRSWKQVDNINLLSYRNGFYYQVLSFRLSSAGSLLTSKIIVRRGQNLTLPQNQNVLFHLLQTALHQ
jgi:hypothetical protein